MVPTKAVDSTLKAINKNDWFAEGYDLFHSIDEWVWFSKWRKKFFSQLKGNILEVGVGTGKNLEYYHPEAKVVGIDFSEKMLEIAKKRLIKSGKKNITLKQMNVEDLEFKDDSFDYVIATCVFCSVPNPVKGLKEIRRVLKPKGKLILIEHVLSKNPLIALIENIHNPLTKYLMGVNINRNTSKNIIKAGFKIVEEKNLALFDVFRLFVAEKELVNHRTIIFKNSS